MSKMRAAGLNAIQMYIFWNEHEPTPGVYNFDGINDIFTFMKIAQSLDLVIILRPGPYVCAEHEYGALPWWLLSQGTGIVPRSSDEKYMKPVKRWFDVLLPKIKPFLYENGGPIITVQVENEYGSYYTCDKNYLESLRDIFRDHLGDNVVYFTTGNTYQFFFFHSLLSFTFFKNKNLLLHISLSLQNKSNDIKNKKKTTKLIMNLLKNE